MISPTIQRTWSAHALSVCLGTRAEFVLCRRNPASQLTKKPPLTHHGMTPSAEVRYLHRARIMRHTPSSRDGRCLRGNYKKSNSLRTLHTSSARSKSGNLLTALRQIRAARRLFLSFQ